VQFYWQWPGEQVGIGLSAKEAVDAAQVISNATTTSRRICFMYLLGGEKSYAIEYATNPRTNHGGDDRMFENRAIFSDHSA
jgi:hypothetical protein